MADLQATGAASQEDFYRLAIKNKFALQGLCFQLSMYEHTDQIKKLIDEAKASGDLK